MGFFKEINIFGKKELPKKDNPFENGLKGEKEDVTKEYAKKLEDDSNQLEDNNDYIETPELEDGLVGVQIAVEERDLNLRKGLAEDGDDWNNVIIKEEKK